ncbi:1-deoxy-D-xylulose 5-phosphate reductoisomerase Dxr [Thermacetogenium phaeum DSM 12270]|uniref:1-deoxy-D-xylulose 5-phosphate reductoisomerase n=1 Tax=Thermacetogenium phaeum (strain ATCC BAA-254 / DSM 26808 / PB) TaxID=1089553 RepID=K4LHC5_THEPS|nr:1-deoxy-D-xylulose-5-phosphate reductoisomerase [Thermacetogenium phaeum]AFV11345.1 1-deoxy-D-xylulose 5-phosphate reductoisomerase Dxr [Thermacetogenium phaeum DSM 12270]MDN5365608.1 1-deoxy-D-xylulose-5-phosphate reductoisomerase [Thermacetogenium sp.]
MKKNVVILGSTGSIGKQALEVIGWHRGSLRVFGLAAYRNIELLEEQVRAFDVPYAAVGEEAAAKVLQERLKDVRTTCLVGEAGLLELVRHPEADLVLVAVSGTAGLRPTLEAISQRKPVALANKETLVAGGSLVMKAALANGVPVIPVDSEHSAIHQCLNNENRNDVAKLIITGSGGPFREASFEELQKVTPEAALRHPTWQMGTKITIDSATLMNKGLEVIEARWLFEVDYDRIEVIIHPQSIVHSLVAYKDGAVLAQLGWPDMRVPIQYALFYPERRSNNLKQLDLASVRSLTFEKPDLKRFPCLRLAYEAGKIGGTMPAVMNAANEIAVFSFLKGEIPFMSISAVIAECMELHIPQTGEPDLDGILAADRWSREQAKKVIKDRHGG